MFERQFLITRTNVRVPETFERVRVKGWWLSYDPNLPVSTVFSDNCLIGYLIGSPIFRGKLYLVHTLLDVGDLVSVDRPSKLPVLLEHLSGRFVFIETRGATKIYPDHFSTMPVVYFSSGLGAASTAELLEYSLSKKLARKEKSSYFPFGLTQAVGVRRLIANHCLNLENGRVVRFWPTGDINLCDSDEIYRNIRRAVDSVKNNIDACAKAFPINSGLTAGRDSRVLLACMSEYARRRCTFYTRVTLQPSLTNSRDIKTAEYLARKCNLTHYVSRTKQPTESERRAYECATDAQNSCHNAAYYTGVFSSFDKDAIALFGHGGEVAAAYFSRPKDKEQFPTAEDLLSRMEVEVSKEDVEEFELWTKLLPESVDNRLAVELAYIENRISSWASPKLLAVPFRASINPFADRRYIGACFALPYDMRKSREAQRLMIECVDENLATVPFESIPGVKGLFAKLVRNRFWKMGWG